MPAIVQYASGFPSAQTPIEASASVNDEGLVTGHAVFLVENGDASYAPGSTIEPGIFKGLAGREVQTLLVQDVSANKENGLFYLRISVIGVIAQPLVNTQRRVFSSSFSKTVDRQISGPGGTEFQTLFHSFEYQAEAITAEYIQTVGSDASILVEAPRLLNRWNINGRGRIVELGLGENNRDDNVGSAVIVFQRILETKEFVEIGRGIERVTVTKQITFE
jgi:hypothetical protein